MIKGLKFLFELLRVKEWYESKIPFAMCFLILAYLKGEFRAANQFVIVSLCCFIFMLAFLAFSYLINDFSDIEIDYMVGKKKVIYGLNKSIVILVLVLLAILGNIPLIIYANFSFRTIIAIIITYLLGIAYSMKPIRFKERGFWGLVECSIAQRCMPIIVIGTVVENNRIVYAWFLLQSFLIGMRYIFIHQVIDCENDKMSGVSTFAVKNYRVSCIGIYVGFFGEIINLIVLFINYNRIEILIMILLVVLLETLQAMNVRRCINAKVFLTFYCVPLEAFYNIYFIICLTICLVRDELHMFPLLCIEILYLAVAFWRKFRMILVLFEKRKIGQYNVSFKN